MARSTKNLFAIFDLLGSTSVSLQRSENRCGKKNGEFSLLSQSRLSIVSQTILCTLALRSLYDCLNQRRRKFFGIDCHGRKWAEQVLLPPDFGGVTHAFARMSKSGKIDAEQRFRTCAPSSWLATTQVKIAVPHVRRVTHFVVRAPTVF